MQVVQEANIGRGKHMGVGTAHAMNSQYRIGRLRMMGMHPRQVRMHKWARRSAQGSGFVHFGRDIADENPITRRAMLVMVMATMQMRNAALIAHMAFLTDGAMGSLLATSSCHARSDVKNLNLIGGLLLGS